MPRNDSLFLYFQLGSSLFASNVGSLHFVGLAGSGAEAGISIAIYEINVRIYMGPIGFDRCLINKLKCSNY